MAVLSPRVYPAAVLLLALAACARPAPHAAAAASSAPHARHLSVRPHVVAAVPERRVPASAARPSAPSSTATPAPKPTPVRRAPDAAPRILKVDIATVVHAGQRVTGQVTTTTNVASVEVRIATYGIVMQKTGEGTFAIDYAVADVPFFLRGTYTMHVIARNTAGVRDEREMPLTIQ